MWSQFWGTTPSPDPYFCWTFWGSTPSLAPFSYISHLRWWGANYRSRSISSSVYLIIIFSYLYVSHIFFYFSSASLITLNHDLQLTVLCRLRDFFQRWNWYVLLLNISGQFNFLLWKLFFFTFSHICQIYVAEVLIIHFWGTLI